MRSYRPTQGRIWFFFLVPLILSVAVFAQRGAITQKVSLQELTTRAHTIVHGHVTSARVEPLPDHPDLTTVVVEMKVSEVLKGEPAQRFTFRQFIWDVRDKDNAAGYRKGQELVLLLNAPSRLGLRSPQGMDQGKFQIERVGDKAYAVNGNSNVYLFAGSEAPGAAAPEVPQAVRDNPRHLTLDQLKQLIRSYAGGRQ